MEIFESGDIPKYTINQVSQLQTYLNLLLDTMKILAYFQI